MMRRIGPDQLFGSKVQLDDIKTRSVRGGFIMMGTQGVKFLLQTFSTVILARLLTPDDFGLVGMVSVVINFILIFKDVGLSLATIQKAEITRKSMDSMFWITVSISSVLGLIIIALSPTLVGFYSREELRSITVLLGFSFIVSGLSIQHAALLRRHLLFDEISYIQISASFISLTVSVLCALLGYGYWSLVVGTVSHSVFTTIFTFYYCQWVPGKYSYQDGLMEMVKFGGGVTSFNVANYFSRNFDKILIGKYFGPVELGYYSKAYQLLMLPLNQVREPLSQIAVPALSRLVAYPDKYRKAFFSVQEKLCLFMVPPIGVMAASSDWIIELIFGPSWLPASQMFQWLSIISLFQLSLSSGAWLLITQGKIKTLVTFGLWEATLNVLSFIIGLNWGANGIAAAYALTGVFVRSPALMLTVTKSGPVKLKAYLMVVAKYFIPAFVIYALVLFVRYNCSTLTPMLGLLMSLFIYIVVFFAMIIVSAETKKHVYDVINWFKSYFYWTQR